MTRFMSWLVLAVGAMLMAAAWALAQTPSDATPDHPAPDHPTCTERCDGALWR